MATAHKASKLFSLSFSNVPNVLCLVHDKDFNKDCMDRTRLVGMQLCNELRTLSGEHILKYA